MRRGRVLAGHAGAQPEVATATGAHHERTRGDVGPRVYASPALFPIVAPETPDGKVLLTCAEQIET